jgi:hypothetical protein
MTWNLMWEPTDNTGSYLIQVWVEDSFGMLSNMTSLSVNMVGTALCALKTRTDGGFYVPNPAYVKATYLRVEMLFDNSNITGDQTGGTSPYPAITNYPDGKVSGGDLIFLASKFGSYEGETSPILWDYMADIVPDRRITGDDLIYASKNFGQSGSYIYDLSGVSVKFSTGDVESPDANGFLAIPASATSFNVTRNGTPIGAMIIFCG